MLDHGVSRVRSDELRTFIQEQRRVAEQRQLEAIESDLKSECFAETGKIEAYDEVLQHLKAFEQSSQ